MLKKEDDKMTGSNDDSLVGSGSTSARMSSSDAPAGSAAPRAARFGEGQEGSAARRERGVSGPRAGLLERAGLFLHDVRAEMKRVAWPTALEVRNTTIITIIAVIFFAVYLLVVDRGLVFLITQLERLVGWLFSAI
ncbi:MAG: preprotein translocase subunit SecE [Acidobacteriota bacterium]|nr:preprotein translocase subunit SecE [Acidobacteriota bacterium]